MILPPLDETPRPRVFTPGHFENFVGARLTFAPDADHAMDAPAATIADAASTDIDADSAGPLGELVDVGNDLDAQGDLADVADITTAVDALEGDLIDQQTQPLPVVDPNVLGGVPPDPNTPPPPAPVPTEPQPPDTKNPGGSGGPDVP
jgi:hypothetical protein